MREIILGPDGKPSGKRIIGVGLAVAGVLFLGGSMFVPAMDTLYGTIKVLGPGALCIFGSAMFWGIITQDKLNAMIGKTKNEGQ